MTRRFVLTVLVATLLGGRAVKAEPLRVAALLPCVADAIAELPPQQVVLVASVRRSLHEPPPAGVGDLGNPHSPSLERLAEARPQLVVGDRRMQGPQAQSLARSGAELLLIDTSSVAATFAGLQEMAQRAGAGPQLEQRIAAARIEIEALRLPTPLATLPLFGAPDTFLVVTSSTWLGDLLAQLGFQSVVPLDSATARLPGYLPVSDELLTQLRPEIVLLLAHGEPDSIRAALLRRLADGGPWASLRNGVTHGVHVLDPQIFQSNPGLAMPAAARALIVLASTPSKDAR